jgi:hypothetical protein
MSARTARAGIVLAVLCLLCLPSCITASLWEDHCQCGPGWTEADITWRAILTPLALLADAILISAYVCCRGNCHCH